MNWNTTAREVVFRLREDHGLSSEEAWEAADRSLVKLEAYGKGMAQSTPAAAQEQIVTKADIENFFGDPLSDVPYEVGDLALGGDSDAIQIVRAAIIRQRKDRADGLTITLKNRGALMEKIPVEIQDGEWADDAVNRTLREFVNDNYNSFGPGDVIEISSETPFQYERELS